MKNNIYSLPVSILVGAMFISFHGTVAYNESSHRHLIQKRYSFGGARDNTRALFLRGSQRKTKRGRIGQWESCPYLQNCQCKTKRTGLDITCNGVTYEQLEADMEVLKTKERNIGYFKIRNCDIPKLKDFLFMGIKITYLYIVDCKLLSLEPESLSSQQNTLQHLVLSSNLLRNVPTKAITTLTTLQTLDLNANNISVLHANAFAGLKKLTKLSFYNNKIRKINANAFKEQERMKYDVREGRKLDLNLGHNHLDKVPTKALKNLKILDNLDLKENRIRDLVTNDFAGLDNLDHLTLQHNEISNLRNEAFKGLPKLSSLYIDNNRISVIEPEAFRGLENKLETLQLAGNLIKEFPTKALQDFKNLKTIYVNNNKINQLDGDAFEGYGKTISYLWLQENQISNIPPTTFQSLYRIERLKLSANKLTTIPYELVEPILRSVLHLEIHDNPLVCNCDLTWYRQWIDTKKDKMQEDERERLLDLECRDPENDRRRYKIRNVPDKVCCYF